MYVKSNGFLVLLVCFFIALVFIVNSFGKINTKVERGGNLISCVPGDYTGQFDVRAKSAFFEGNELKIPAVASFPKHSNVLGLAHEERWIEVDLSEQKLKAWDGGNLYLETPVSTGLAFTPTPVGEYRIWIKLKSTKMSGGTGRNYYYLPNVPYVMYFYKGYGLHGTYWHSDFGRPRSHGCVNLPTPIAEQLYYWTSPVMPEGKTVVRATEDNPGTRIVVHE